MEIEDIEKQPFEFTRKVAEQHTAAAFGNVSLAFAGLGIGLQKLDSMFTQHIDKGRHLTPDLLFQMREAVRALRADYMFILETSGMVKLKSDKLVVNSMAGKEAEQTSKGKRPRKS